MSKRLSDDEKRYFTDQISMLKGENERLTKYIEDYEDDTRKVLADECAPDEKHCTCVPVLRAENERLKNKLMDINVECLDKTATRESILVVLLAVVDDEED